MQTSTFALASLPALQKQIQIGSLGRTQILGSQLGVLIKRAAWETGCEIDLRLFGGLRAFATTYLRDYFRIRTGGVPGVDDDVYDVVRRRADSRDSRSSVEGSRELGSTNALWQAFSNPNSGLLVLITPSHELSVASASDQPMISNLRQVQSITATDYFNWAKEYAEVHMTEANRPAAQQLLSAHDPESFANPWFVLISADPTRYHVRRWEEFRLEKIINTFTRRLAEMGCPDAKLRELTELLVKSRTSRRYGALTAVDSTHHEIENHQRSVEPASSQSSKDSDEELRELRKLLHLAVDRLGVDQLKSIPIPAGIIVEVRSRTVA